MRKIYADHAATTPVHPAVREAMLRALTDDWGNPSSIHAFGRAARKAVELAREQVAQLIGARPQEIFFTSGATESDNWALMGVAYANRARGQHLVSTTFEHHAVLDCLKRLETEGFSVTYVPVDPGSGRVPPEALAAAVRDDTVLVSVMAVNNEIGTVQDVPALVRAVKAKNPATLFHTDAVQAVGVIPVDVGAWGVDLLSLTAHKIYGPKGSGALFIRKGGFRFTPLAVGGGQERKLRAGTENTPGIVGLGKAAELARLELALRAAHQRDLRDRFLVGALALPGVRLNGDPVHRHPGNANISIEGADGEALLLNLDMKGIAASSGSACTSGSIEPSHVLVAIGCSTDQAHGSLRFSFGMGNTAEDVDYIVAVLPEILQRLRSLTPSGRG